MQPGLWFRSRCAKQFTRAALGGRAFNSRIHLFNVAGFTRGVCERQVRRTSEALNSGTGDCVESDRFISILPDAQFLPFSSTLIFALFNMRRFTFCLSLSLSLFFVKLRRGDSRKSSLVQTLLRYRYSNCISAGYRYAERGMG